MVYSMVLDGAFCISCALFANDRKGLGTLVNHPFTKWHKKKAKVHPHTTFKYHQEALAIADQFIASIENPHATVSVMHDTKRAENIVRNRHIVKCIVSCSVEGSASHFEGTMKVVWIREIQDPCCACMMSNHDDILESIWSSQCLKLLLMSLLKTKMK